MCCAEGGRSGRGRVASGEWRSGRPKERERASFGRTVSARTRSPDQPTVASFGSCFPLSPFLIVQNNHSLKQAHPDLCPMSTTIQPGSTSPSSSPSPSLETAANRVFRVPELVENIIKDFIQAQLFEVSTLTAATQAETERALYQSPSVHGLEVDDPRLAVLSAALRERPGRVRSFALSARTPSFPARSTLQLLANQFTSLASLALLGQSAACSRPPDLIRAVQTGLTECCW